MVLSYMPFSTKSKYFQQLLIAKIKKHHSNQALLSCYYKYAINMYGITFQHNFHLKCKLKIQLS